MASQNNPKNFVTHPPTFCAGTLQKKICDNRLDILSHIDRDDTSPRRVVIDSVEPTAAESENDDRGSLPRTKKTRNRGPKKRGQKMAPSREVYMFGYT